MPDRGVGRSRFGIDMVGLDILGAVVGNMTTNVHDERSDLRLPGFFVQMLQRKWLGALQGYYSYEHKSIVVAEGQICPLPTLVHELQHALADHQVTEQPALLGQADLRSIGELSGPAEVVGDRGRKQQIGVQPPV